MANDDKSGTNLASSVIVAALVATGAYFFHREAPLLDSRPAETEAGIHEQQTIVARLWQDPFEAVNKALDELGKPDPNNQCQETQNGESPCKSPLKGRDKETLVLGVTVPGLPYQEDAERRRRTRYAVLAGLERAGFVPKDARHIDYFVLKQSPASLEMPPALSLLSWGTQPARNLAPATVESKLPLSGLLQGYRLQYVQARADPALAEPTIVPYERFSRSGQDEGPKRIIVLWLTEDALTSEPLAWFSSLINFLHLGSYKGNNIKIIGPFSSDILHEMVVETRKCKDVFCDDNENKKGKWPELTNVTFYPYGASAADDQILEPLSNPYQTVQHYFAQFDIHVQRTVATNDTLAGGIH